MRIRKLLPDDKMRLLKLMEEFWIGFTRGVVLKGELRDIEALKDHNSLMAAEFDKYLEWHSYVAEIDTQVVGFVVAHIEMKLHKVLDRQGYIEELFVSADYRNRGIGKSLMNHIIAVLKEEKCQVVGIDAYSANKNALEFYRNLGFMDKCIVLTYKI